MIEYVVFAVWMFSVLTMIFLLLYHSYMAKIAQTEITAPNNYDYYSRADGIILFFLTFGVIILIHIVSQENPE
jgi:phosphate starvation-inducible membrane PsiE